jgi:hypothetical protein
MLYFRYSGPNNNNQLSIINFIERENFFESELYTWNNCFISKLGMAYGFINLSLFFGIEIYPQYNYIFILLVLAVFFSSWNAFILIFRRQAYKILLIAAILNSTVAFGLSQLNILELFPIENNLRKQNIHYKYKYEKVESEYFLCLTKLDLVENLFLVFPKDGMRMDPVILNHNEEINPDSIFSFIQQIRNERDEADRKFLTVNLCIDKNIPMYFVNKLKVDLAKAGQYKLAYAVLPKRSKYDNGTYSRYSIPFKQPPLGVLKNSPPPPISPYRFLESSYNEFELITIFHQNENEFSIGDHVLGLDSLQSFYREAIANTEKKIFVFAVNEDLNFEFYLRAFIAYRLATEEARKNYALNYFSKNYDMLNSQDQKKINRKLSNRYIDVSPGLLDELIKQGKLSKNDAKRYYSDLF